LFGGIEVEDGRNQGPDVLDHNGLGVKTGDRRGFLKKKGLMKIAMVRDLEVEIGEEGVLIGGKVIGVGVSGGGVLLLSVSQSVARTSRVGIAS